MKRKFELSDGSFSVSGIQEYFEYILKNAEKRLEIRLEERLTILQ